MRSLLTIITISFLLISCQNATDTPLEKDFQRLDETIEFADEYIKLKEYKINTIENMLHSRGVSALQQYNIYEDLYQECLAFQFDKAKDILDNQIELAQSINEPSLIFDAQINKAQLLTSAGYYHEAGLLFEQIDTLCLDRSQMNKWYIAQQKYLYDYREYVSSSGIEVPQASKIDYYQNKILEYLPSDSYDNQHIRIIRLIDNQEFEEALKLNTSLLNTLDSTSRNYAVQTYWQGLILNSIGKNEEAVRWWIESAICDIKGAIKDNASLPSIAITLEDPKNADRAFRYIRFSFEDAGFYNSKLRRVQIATSFPAIEKAYTTNKAEYEKDMRKFIFIISLISFILLILCALIVRFYIKEKRSSKDLVKKSEQILRHTASIEEAKENLRKTNLALFEANAAKEEYLGLYLSMCSRYLDKLRKTLSYEQYETELKNFYKTFDTSFIQLYPNFVEDFNSLIQEDSRLYPKEGELLNTELRIFALIKLGITQSSHIASLLRYSVNTIYNYRAQVKNAAIENRENFEDLVKKIGSKI